MKKKNGSKEGIPTKLSLQKISITRLTSHSGLLVNGGRAYSETSDPTVPGSCTTITTVSIVACDTR
jgi:hypothetical protein